MRHEPTTASSRQDRGRIGGGAPGRAMAAAALLLLLVGAASGGCVAGRLRVAQSEHIRLTTDNEGPRAYDLVRVMERDYRALVDVFFACAEAQQAEPIDVVALVDEVSFQRLRPERLESSDGFFNSFPQRIVERPPGITMLWQRSTADMHRLFRHEVTHSLIARCMPQAPAWLHEGLAEWLSTAEIEDDEIHLGVPPYFFGRLAYGVGRIGDVRVAAIPPDQLLGVDGLRALSFEEFWVANDLDRTRTHYAGAWALASVLGSGPPPLRRGFAAYRRALSLGTDESEAWDEHLSQLPVAEHYTRFIGTNTREYTSFPLNDSPDVGPLVESAIDGDEAGLFWVRRMPWDTSVARNAALTMLDSVVRRHPERWDDADVASLRAAILLEGGDHPGAVQALRWVDPPEDVAFWRLALRLAYDYTSPPFLGSLRPTASTREEHPSTEEVHALTPRAATPFEHNVLARAWLHLNEFGAALGEAHLAVSEDASCAECWVTLGLAQIQTGDVRRGARSLERGAGLMHASHGGGSSWVRRAGLYAYGAMGRRLCEVVPPVGPREVPSPVDPPPLPRTSEPGSDADAIREVVRSHVDAVLACYEDELALVPTAEGTVRVRFEYGADGRVTSAGLDDSELGGALGCCIVAEVMTWEFPPPTGGGNVSVTHPFTLSRGE